MVNILRLSKNLFVIIMVIAACWIIYKKYESLNYQGNMNTANKKISVLDKVMIGITSVMEEIYPSSSFTSQLTKQKHIIINHLYFNKL
jgi:hypothetical protein